MKIMEIMENIMKKWKNHEKYEIQRNHIRKANGFKTRDFRVCKVSTGTGINQGFPKRQNWKMPNKQGCPGPKPDNEILPGPRKVTTFEVPLQSNDTNLK